jgi:hypothetical protein
MFSGREASADFTISSPLVGEEYSAVAYDHSDYLSREIP